MKFMPRFHWYYIPGHLVFITSVTYGRGLFLSSKENIDLFWNSIRETKDRQPFVIAVYAILPDHFHWLMMLPEEQPNFSRVMRAQLVQCQICD
jgi:putative transposase